MIRRHQWPVPRIVVALTIGVLLAVVTPKASADSTESYPVPHTMLTTTCTAEQIMAATRDTSPIYYQRYLIDYNNKSPQVQLAVQDRIHWFYSMDYAGRRAYSESIATDIYYEQLALAWPNWAKLFFNNNGVVAKATDVCNQYQVNDTSVWIDAS